MRLQLKNITVKYENDVILDRVSFEIRDSEKIAVVGRNGCGKTTLLKTIMGEVETANLSSDEDSGIFISGKQRIGCLRQVSFEDGSISVGDEIRKVFAPVFEAEKRMHEIEARLADQDAKLLSEYNSLQKKMESLNRKPFWNACWKQRRSFMS